MVCAGLGYFVSNLTIPTMAYLKLFGIVAVIAFVVLTLVFWTIDRRFSDGGYGMSFKWRLILSAAAGLGFCIFIAVK